MYIWNLKSYPLLTPNKHVLGLKQILMLMKSRQLESKWFVGKQSIINCTKGLILHKEGNVYTEGWGGSPILWAPFEKQMIDSKKCSS